MPSNPMLSLSLAGWITGVPQRVDEILALLMTTDASQTDLHRGQVKSFQAIIQASNGNPTTIKDNLQQALNDIFLAQFDAVDVNVNVNLPASDGSYRYNIEMNIVITEQGRQYQVPVLINQLANGKFERIVAITNG